MGTRVTGSDLPFWGSLSSPRGHPSADLHASHGTDPERLYVESSQCSLRFTVSQLSTLVLSAQMILCPLPHFWSIAHHHKNIQDSQIFLHTWNLVSLYTVFSVLSFPLSSWNFLFCLQDLMKSPELFISFLKVFPYPSSKEKLFKVACINNEFYPYFGYYWAGKLVFWHQITPFFHRVI